MNSLFNGESASGWAQSRGLHYGDGVFRTILIWNGQALDWDLHMAKLAQDCTALRLQMPAESVLHAEAQRLASAQRRAVLKILVIRQSGGRGYSPSTTASDRLLMTYSSPQYPSTHWTTGINAFRCVLSLAEQPALAGIKHLNRLEQVLASHDWPDGADEGILCDRTAQAVCGTRSNLFWVMNAQLNTPSLDQCGVSGIMRNKIIDLFDQSNVKTRIVGTSWQSLLEADEIFVCNALIGIWPVKQLEHRQWTAPGPVTRALQIKLDHPHLN